MQMLGGGGQMGPEEWREAGLSIEELASGTEVVSVHLPNNRSIENILMCLTKRSCEAASLKESIDATQRSFQRSLSRTTQKNSK